MNSKCDTSLTAETMKNEDDAFEIIIQQMEGGTQSLFFGLGVNYDFSCRLDVRL